MQRCKINVDDLIHKLEFKFNLYHNQSNTINFQNLFKKLLKSLDENELKLFNIVISASTIIQDKYTINVINNVVSSNYRLPTYQTCFSTMDIGSISSFLRHFLCKDSNNKITDDCKNKFVETLHTTLGQGFKLP